MLAAGPLPVSVLAQGFREVEYDRDRDDMVLPRQPNQSAAVFLPHVGGVYHNQFSQCEAFSGNEVEKLKRIRGDRLVVLVVGQHRSARIRGQDFRRPEMVQRKR